MSERTAGALSRLTTSLRCGALPALRLAQAALCSEAPPGLVGDNDGAAVVEDADVLGQAVDRRPSEPFLLHFLSRSSRLNREYRA